MSGRVIVVGSVNVDLVVTVERLPGPGRDRHRRPVRAAPRRQGRQPGRRRGAARAPTSLRRCGRRRRVRERARGRRSRRKASTSAGLRHAAERGDRRRPDPGRRRRREQHRGRRRRERRADLGPGAPGAEAAVARCRTTSSWSGTRSGPARPTRRCAWAGSPARRRSSTRPRPAGSAGHTLDLADVLTPNDGELDDAGRARAARRPRPSRLLGPDPGKRAALVSLGRRGALLVAGRQSPAIPAPRVDAVDTVGAGRHAQRRAGGRARGRSRPGDGGPARGRRRLAWRSRAPAPARGCRQRRAGRRARALTVRAPRPPMAPTATENT